MRELDLALGLPSGERMGEVLVSCLPSAVGLAL